MTTKTNQSGEPSRESRHDLVTMGAALTMLAASLLLGACQSSDSQTQAAADPETTAAAVGQADGEAAPAGGEGSEALHEGAGTGGEADAATDAAPILAGQTGVELWANNCQRCHNFRDPSIYTDTEWDVAMFHMRTRANLTAGDFQKIREFFFSAN